MTNSHLDPRMANTYSPRALPELWKPIPGHEGYEASDRGHVRSLPRVITKANGHTYTVKGCTLKPLTIGNGYWYVCTGGTKREYVHRLVMLAWVGEAKGMEVNHLNGNHNDNRLVNLEYVTPEQNKLHAWLNGFCKKDYRAANAAKPVAPEYTELDITF